MKLCRTCSEEYEDAACENSRCPASPDYDPPCVCGEMKSWRDGSYICVNITCEQSPWYEEGLPAIPKELKWGTREYRLAWGDRVWRVLRRYIWRNPGVTFAEVKRFADNRFGWFRGKVGEKNFRWSMRNMVDNGILVRHGRGWRMVRIPVKDIDCWTREDILDVASIERD